MRTSVGVGVLVLALAVTPTALAGGSVMPKLVRSAATGGLPDSIRVRMLILIAQGNIDGAVEYYLLATGATTAPRWLSAMQRAFDVLNQRAGPCQQVAYDVFEGFKRLGQSPVYVRFVNVDPRELRIGFDVVTGDAIRSKQVSQLGFHIAVKVGERVYDAFTGAAGLKMQEYLARLVNGRLAE